MRVTAVRAGKEFSSEPKKVEVQFPSFSKITSDGSVNSKVNAAWQNTLAATTTNSRREEGFWIKLNTQSEKSSSEIQKQY